MAAEIVPVLLVFFISMVTARIGTGFIKDQRTDFVDFPPKTYRQYDSPVPVGHLRPLGTCMTARCPWVISDH